jgi:hypothetical protein
MVSGFGAGLGKIAWETRIPLRRRILLSAQWSVNIAAARRLAFVGAQAGAEILRLASLTRQNYNLLLSIHLRLSSRRIGAQASGSL